MVRGMLVKIFAKFWYIIESTTTAKRWEWLRVYIEFNVNNLHWKVLGNAFLFVDNIFRKYWFLSIRQNIFFIYIWYNRKNLGLRVEIVAKHKKQRNMIEIMFVKNRKEGETGRLDRSVDLKIVSEYLFSDLYIDPEKILDFNMNTGKIYTKQILFRPEVDIE